MKPKTLAGTVKSLETVLDLAIHLEMTGKAFYENAEKDAKDPKLKTLLSFLMEEEGRHMKTYRRLSNRHSGEPAHQEVLFGEYGMYIDHLISEMTGKLVFNPSLSVVDIVRMAIGFEKDTLLYFTEIKALFSGEDAVLVDEICREEKKHIGLLLAYNQGLESE